MAPARSYQDEKMDRNACGAVLIDSLRADTGTGMGADLVSIYQTAIRTQNSLEPAMVYKAVWFSLALMAMFALSGVLLLIDTCRKHTER